MTVRHKAKLGGIFLCVLFWVGCSFAEDLYPITMEHDVPVPMRDGVVLRADVYRPATPGKYPVLLQCTPYDKNTNVHSAILLSTHGYVVVMQDVRGRFASAGEWIPFLHESEDGYDSVEWAAALPSSDGRVGMFGASYVGATQMLAAIAHPPHLSGICPVITASNYHDGWTYQGGAFEQWFSESWTSGLAQDSVNHYVKSMTNARSGMDVVPLSSYPLFAFENPPSLSAFTKQFAPYFWEWLEHPNYDDYWKRWTIEEHYKDIQVPAYTVAAWYDIFQGGSIRNYLGLKNHAGNESARQKQKLLIAIGGHSGSGRKIGEVDFGPEATKYVQEQVPLLWYDFLFKGVQNEVAKQKPVKIFVMGKNEWREEEEWPLARARQTKYFLHSKGNANSSSGNGVLTMQLPKEEPQDSYLYDPANPTPTTGGPLCCDGHHMPAGPRDQHKVEERQDVLVYATEPFTQDTEVSGPVRLEFFAKSSAVDTDFTAKLVDVWPNGFAQNLTEGIVRARFRESQTEPKLLTPGEVYPLQIDLLSTSNVFLKGHKLLLEISSSNFPRFDRNFNTGEDARLATKMEKATNTIYHDAKHPSALAVSILP